jgi:hypothetical protein
MLKLMEPHKEKAVNVLIDQLEATRNDRISCPMSMPTTLKVCSPC